MLVNAEGRRDEEFKEKMFSLCDSAFKRVIRVQYQVHDWQ
jgi:hypothetical protein